MIEQYLEGTLPEAEKRALEAQAALDEKLRLLIQLYREVNESIGDKDLASLRDQIQKVSADYFKGTKQHSTTQTARDRQPVYMIRRISRIAVAVALVVGIGFTLNTVLNQKKTPSKLFLEYYCTYDADFVVRSQSSEDQSLLDKAVLEYSSGKYLHALQILGQLQTRQPDNCVVVFYKGLSLMGLGDFSNAVLAFEAIAFEKKCPFEQHRDWYMALARLKLNQTKAAAESFQLIANNGGFYSKKARAIYRSLTR